MASSIELRMCVKHKSTFFSKDTIFCPVCGEKTVELPECKNCGTKIFAESNFCTKCGAPRAEATAN